MARTSKAWVMDVGAGWRVAAGGPHVVEYLLVADVLSVPGVPRHCAGLLIWRERLIPLLDLEPLLAPRGEALSPGRSRRAVVLAYQEAPGQPLSYGALLVGAAPDELWVSDDMAAALPHMPQAFRHIARACFAEDDRSVPILDVQQLFARPLPADLVLEMSERGLVHGDAPGRHPVASACAAVHRAADDEHGPVRGFPPADDGAAARDKMPVRGSIIPFVLARPVPVGAEADQDNVAPPESAQAEATVTPIANVSPGMTAPADARNAEPAGPARSVSASTRTATGRAVARNPVGSTSQSRRAIQPLRRYRPMTSYHSRRNWWALGAVLIIVMLAAFVFGEFFTPAPPPPAPPEARDVAPGGITPASVPSAPAQPPK